MRNVARSSRSGMTLVEVLVAVSVVLIAVIGILYSYAKAIELNAIGQGSVIATQAVKNKIEQIKGTAFSTIFTTYNNTTFTAVGLNGRGLVTVDRSNSRLLEVKVIFCWRLGSGRIIGEDRDLDGVLDAGEDANGNGQLDAYVQIVTRIYG
ncbi:MAG: prepilin-type N-terminal cleavage/methylation domain-containing protein [Candidatus Omnitrophica bacterium]|nr:prepilin-type N-terminal cleavage/methylation domain-containing protein [Candidatus Omnitrophota bacterium]